MQADETRLLKPFTHSSWETILEDVKPDFIARYETYHDEWFSHPQFLSPTSPNKTALALFNMQKRESIKASDNVLLNIKMPKTGL